MAINKNTKYKITKKQVKYAYIKIKNWFFNLHNFIKIMNKIVLNHYNKLGKITS
jgi:hypothetical protein